MPTPAPLTQSFVAGDLPHPSTVPQSRDSRHTGRARRVRAARLLLCHADSVRQRAPPVQVSALPPSHDLRRDYGRVLVARDASACPAPQDGPYGLALGYDGEAAVDVVRAARDRQRYSKM